MGQRQHGGFVKRAFDLLQAAHIGPARLRDIHCDLAQGRWAHLLQGFLEIRSFHAQFADLVDRDEADIEIDVGHQPPNRRHGGLPAQRRQIRTDEAVGQSGQAVEGHPLAQRHAAAMDFQDLLPAFTVGNADLGFPVEAPRSPKGRVEAVGNVGRGGDDHLTTGVQPIHQRQELCHHPPFELAIAVELGSAGGDRVDFIDEDECRCVLPRLLEDPSQMRFAGAVCLVDDLRTVDLNEVDAGLVGHRPGDKRLAGAGRPIKQDALRRIDAQMLEHLRMLQRQLDDLADPPHLFMQSADVLIGHRARGIRRADAMDLGGLGEDHLSRRIGPLHDEGVWLRSERRHAHAVAALDRDPVEQLRQIAGR